MPQELTRKQLYELVWKKPIIHIAEEYGLSGRGLAKLCERNSIPVPPRGYWAREQAGQKLKRPPLITFPDTESNAAILIKQYKLESPQTEKKVEKKEELPFEILEAIKSEEYPANKIKVPKTLSSPHPIVARWIEEERWDKERTRSGLELELYGRIHTPNPLEKRRRILLSTIFKALEQRGFKIETDRYYQRMFWVKTGWDAVCFELEERVRQYRHYYTEEERKKFSSWDSDRKWTQKREPTGKFRLIIRGDTRGWEIQKFEEEDILIEEQLNKIMVLFIKAVWERKKYRLEREAEENRRWEEQKARKALEEERKAEQERKEQLRQESLDWKEAQTIRDYVRAVEKAGGYNVDDFKKWSEWALNCADELDPITSNSGL